MYRLQIFLLALGLGPSVFGLPSSETLYSNGFTYYISADSDYLNWSEARQRCIFLNMRLLEIRNFEEQRNYMAVVETLGNVGWRWGGATDNLVENEWRWDSDNAVANYTNWDRNARGHLPHRNCLQVLGKLFNYRWHDENCVARQRFVCYRASEDNNIVTTTKEPPTSSPQVTTGSPLSGSSLPENVATRNHEKVVNRMKYYISSEKTNFHMARLLCADRGMQMLEPSSAEKIIDLKNLLGQTESTQSWIGLSDAGRKGRHYWLSDMSSVNFQKFQTGEQSASNAGKDCVTTGPSRLDYDWQTMDCLQEYPVICQKRSLAQGRVDQ